MITFVKVYCAAFTQINSVSDRIIQERWSHETYGK